MVRIGEIRSGSIADSLELQIGTRILTINGSRVRDGLDFAFLTADGDLELEAIDAEGERVIYEIEREPGESLGIIPAHDKIRECANECVFCFIDGNPPGARPPLWVRDDDFRLSFTYGSYVTLTNLGPKGLQRLVDQRITPLYVSVHSTTPETRIRLLKNDRAGLVMNQLRHLLDGGLQVHTQVVLCPDWNDGADLDKTISDLYELGPDVLTLSIVPVGLTRYNLGRPVRLLTGVEARQAIAQVQSARKIATNERGVGWCYAADEMFLIAGEAMPGAEYYDAWPLLENGVGAVRNFIDGFERHARELAPRAGVNRVRVVTGVSMEPLITSMIPRLRTGLGCTVEVEAVVNEYFGPTVTVAGLLAGQDVLSTIGPGREGDLILLPSEALNGDRVFIDGLEAATLEGRLAPAEVRFGEGLLDPLLAP